MKLYVKPVGMLGTNCYIVADDGGKCAVIDPGAQPEKLIDFLEIHEFKPEYILLTHGHYDHIGAVKAIAEKYGCKIAIGKNDAEQLTDREKSLATSRGMSEKDYLMTPDLQVAEGDHLTVGNLTFSVLDTPGHTRGGVCYLCGNLLFSGDTLFSGDVGRCDLYGGDFTMMQQSLKKLAAQKGDYRVLPGHGPESTLEQERLHNPYMREHSDDALS